MSLRNLLACTATEEAEDVALKGADERVVECRAAYESNAPIASPLQSQTHRSRHCSMSVTTNRRVTINRVSTNQVTNAPPMTPPPIEQCRATND